MADTVLLTGISGFLAKHVMLALLDRGHDVRGTVRSPAKIDAVESIVRKAGFDVARARCVMADLTSDDGWKAAMAGCSAVIHTASPFPMSSPRDQKALVPQARDGTLRVLRAAHAAGIARVVVTSSIAAVGGGSQDMGERAFTEADWSNPGSPTLPAYQYSKTVAERAAWDEATRLGSLKLTAINPGFIQGPLLDGDFGTSGEAVRMLLAGRYPGVPDIDFSVVDVRDVALAHVLALEDEETAGQRIICTSGNLTLMEMGRVLASAFPQYRRRLPKFVLPDFMVRAVGLFDPNAAGVVPELGRRRLFSNARSRALLGMEYRSADVAVVEMARSLIDLKAV